MALAEPWTEVVALQRDQARCAADIAAIKQACAKDHDKGHALECAQCWPRLVSRLRDLYFKPSSPEWFTGRRDFLQDLDNLFTKAQSSQNATLDLKPIDQRVRKEKEGWFRDKAADLGLLKATQSQGEARELQSKLSDRELPVEQLVSELRNTFPAARPDSSNETFFRQFLEQMGAAQSPKEQAGIYTEVVFKADQNSAESAKTEKYAKLINGGTPPGQALETLLRDRESSQGEQDDRRRLRNQLEELRRAKAAYQLAQSRRDKVRQEKARATAAAAAAASAREAPTLPSCATCSGAVDPQSFEMCSICQVLSSCEAGVSEPVLWCSEQCRNQTFDTHVSTTHECAGGDDCVNTYEEDIDMDQDSRVLVFCRECINDIKNPVSVFCSPRCYESNFQRHREHVHLPDREKNRRNVDDRGTLEFESVDERRYRALKIEEHFKTLDDALVEYSSMTGAALS